MAPKKASNGDFNSVKVSLGHFSSFMSKNEISIGVNRVHAPGNYGAQISAKSRVRKEAVVRNDFRPK
jgi:hypothetical protein